MQPEPTCLFSHLRCQAITRSLENVLWNMFDRVMRAQSADEHVMHVADPNSAGVRDKLVLSRAPPDLVLPFAGPLGIVKGSQSLLVTQVFGIPIYMNPTPLPPAGDVVVPAWSARPAGQGDTQTVTAHQDKWNAFIDDEGQVHVQVNCDDDILFEQNSPIFTLLSNQGKPDNRPENGAPEIPAGQTEKNILPAAPAPEIPAGQTKTDILPAVPTDSLTPVKGNEEVGQDAAKAAGAEGKGIEQTVPAKAKDDIGKGSPVLIEDDEDETIAPQTGQTQTQEIPVKQELPEVPPQGSTAPTVQEKSSAAPTGGSRRTLLSSRRLLRSRRRRSA